MYILEILRENVRKWGKLLCRIIKVFRIALDICSDCDVIVFAVCIVLVRTCLF